MGRKISLRAVSVTLFVAMLVTYILCVAGDVLFGWTMYTVWAPLLPGFTWPLSVAGFLIGLLWLVAYSLYIGIILVVPYNVLTRAAEG